MKSIIQKIKNRKTKPLTALLFVVALFAIIACKKESNPTTFLEEIDGKQFSKTLILNSIDSLIDTIPVVTITPADCKKDNVWSFNKTTKRFVLDEGATKCDALDNQTKDQGAVEELNGGSQLRVIGGTTNEIWEIESRSASSFRVSYFARNGSNKLVKFRVTFTKL
jgi:hypothetical protein